MELSSSKTIEENLKPYLKIEKTTAIEYEIIQLLLKVVKNKPELVKSSTFLNLYTNLT